MRIQLLRERVRLVHAIAFTHSSCRPPVRARRRPALSALDRAGRCRFIASRTPRRRSGGFSATRFGPARSNGRRGLCPSSSSSGSRPGSSSRCWARAILPIRLEHGPSPVLGFRVGALAYCTDVSRIPDASRPLLEGLDVLVLDALRYEPHPTHFSLSEALAVIEVLKPRRTFLTHLSHSFDHGPTQAALPPQVALAYDGLQLEF